MPSITGGSQTDRDYAPHMYILGLDGNPDVEDDWQFVGNLGNVYVHVYGETRGDSTDYHIGATVLGELIADVQHRSRSSAESSSRDLPRVPESISVGELPQDVLRKALDRALDGNAASLERQVLIRLLLPLVAGEDIPIEFPEPLEADRAFNGLPAEQDAEIDKFRQAREIVGQLRVQLGFDQPTEVQ